MDQESTVQRILVSVPEYIRKVKCDTSERTLPFKCAVNGCPNTFKSFKERDKYPYKFHNFPLNEGLRQVWKERCGLSVDKDVGSLKVCSDHFELDDYIRNYKAEFTDPNFKRKLNSDAIPRKNLQADVNTDLSNDGLLSFTEIKEVVDENEMLKTKYNSLLKTKAKLIKNIYLFDKRIENKSKELVKNTEILEMDVKPKKPDLKGKKNVVRKVFSNAQINLLLGKKRVIWSEEDLAKAFTLRHMSNKECYLYLKNTLNMPLPALACVQKWAASIHSTS